MAINTGAVSGGYNLRQGPIDFVEIKQPTDIGTLLSTSLDTGRKVTSALRNMKLFNEIDDQLAKGQLTKAQADNAKSKLNMAEAEADIELLPQATELKKKVASNAIAVEDLVRPKQIENAVFTESLVNPAKNANALASELDVVPTNQAATIASNKAKIAEDEITTATAAAEKAIATMSADARLALATKIAQGGGSYTGEDGYTYSLDNKNGISVRQASLAPTEKQEMVLNPSTNTEQLALVKRDKFGRQVGLEFVAPNSSDKAYQEQYANLVAYNSPQETATRTASLSALKSALDDVDKYGATITGEIAAKLDEKDSYKRMAFQLANPSAAAARDRLASLSSQFSIVATQLLKGAISNKELEIAKSSVLNPNSTATEVKRQINNLITQAEFVKSANAKVTELVAGGMSQRKAIDAVNAGIANPDQKLINPSSAATTDEVPLADQTPTGGAAPATTAPARRSFKLNAL